MYTSSYTGTAYPAIGRVLSPDNYIQDATNTQNYNRYSYCLNNPLRYSDPSGWSLKPDDWRAVPTFNTGFSGGYTGYIGPGSGNHWSDAMRDVYGNFMLMNSSGFMGYYGVNNEDYFTKLLPNITLLKQGNPTRNSNGEYGYWITTKIATAQTGTHDANGNIVGYTPLYVTNAWVKLNSNTSTQNAQGGGWLSTLNTVNTWAGTGAFATGKVLSDTRIGSNIAYRIAYKGISNASNYIKPAGVGTSIVGAGIGLYKFLGTENKTWGVYGQLGVSFLSSGFTLSGVTAPIGIGIGVIDAFGGFNGFYNYLDSQQNLYNTTGGVIIPMNGVPNYFQLNRK